MSEVLGEEVLSEEICLVDTDTPSSDNIRKPHMKIVWTERVLCAGITMPDISCMNTVAETDHDDEGLSVSRSRSDMIFDLIRLVGYG